MKTKVLYCAVVGLSLLLANCTTTKNVDGSSTTAFNVTPEQLAGLSGLVSAIKTQKTTTPVVTPTK